MYGDHCTTGRKRKKQKIKEMVKSAGFMQDWLPCTHTDTHTHYTLCPDFQLLPDESQGVSKHKVQQIKEEKL